MVNPHTPFFKIVDIASHLFYSQLNNVYELMLSSCWQLNKLKPTLSSNVQSLYAH